MEENWDRRSEVVRLELAKINEMVRPGLAGRKVVGAEVIASGHANTNYKLALEGSDEALVLRLYTRQENACLKEFNLFKALRDRVPMAEMVFVEPELSEFGFPYSVLKWVDGVLLDAVVGGKDEKIVGEVGRDIGRKLAAIGTYHFEQPGLIGQNLEMEVPFSSTADSWRSFIRRCLFEGEAGRHLGAVWTERLWQFVEEKVGLVEDLTRVNSLVHADFKGSNILVREEAGEWGVAAVLDWEFAYAGSFLSDIGTLLRYRKQFNPAFAPNFRAGFEEQGGKLPEEWPRAAGWLDLLNLCDFLNRPRLNELMKQEVIQLIVDTLES